MTVLLREHITIAADLIAAAKAGDKTKLAATQAAWQQNGDRIAVFLNGANPQAWKLGELKAMFRDHLRLTTQEAVAGFRANGRPTSEPTIRSTFRSSRWPTCSQPASCSSSRSASANHKAPIDSLRNRPEAAERLAASGRTRVEGSLAGCGTETASSP